MSDAHATAHTEAAPLIFHTVEGTRPALTRRALSWPELARQLTKHRERGDKTGRGFILADFTAPHRNAANLASYHGLCLDLDTHTDSEAGEIHEPPPPEEAAERLRAAGLAGVIFTTHNHEAAPELNKGKPSGPRYRLVLPLAEPIEPAELESYTRRAAALLDLAGDYLDPASWRPAQFFYAPSCRPGAPRYAVATEGRYLSAADLEAVELPALELPQAANDPQPTPPARMPSAPAEQPARGFDATKAAARGHWPHILARLGIEAPAHARKHGPCPGCGGRDRFRFDDLDGRGTFICSQGGAGTISGDGFNLVQHAKGCTEADALRLVRDALGMDRRPERPAAPPQRHAFEPWDAEPDWPANDNPPPQPKPRFQFVRVGELLGNLKPIDWLVKGFFESDSLALMFGDPGCGKSFLAFDVAASVATGTPWHGRAVKQGPVFVIAGEGNNGIARRFAAWSQANGVDLADAPLFTSTRAASLTEPESARAVADAVEELASLTGEQPRMIVVDTLARNFGAGDENSTADMGRFISLVDEHLKARYRACVLIVHHTGHGDKTRARGSIALKGAIDAEYGVSRDETGLVRIEAGKMKEAERPEPMAFHLEQVQLQILDENGDPVTSCAPRSASYVEPPKTGKTGRGKNQTTAMQVLRDLEDEHRERLARSGLDTMGARVREDDWRDCLERDHGINRYRFREVRKSLTEAGLVIPEPGGYVRTA